MTHRAINFLLSAFWVIAILWALGVLGPVLDGQGQEESAAAKQAIQGLDEQARFAKAAQAMCGPNAAYTDLGNNEVQCMTHKDRKTIKGYL